MFEYSNGFKIQIYFADAFYFDREGKTLLLSSIQYESALLNWLIREVVLFSAR